MIADRLNLITSLIIIELFPLPAAVQLQTKRDVNRTCAHVVNAVFNSIIRYYGFTSKLYKTYNSCDTHSYPHYYNYPKF